MQNELSVVVPVYDVEKYLPRCIDSILNQTYRVDEIILVDDGSTDKSGQICDEYKEKYSNIQVIHKNNGGLVSARKCGIRLATCKYATYVDSDDWIEPNMYEELMAIMKRDDSDLVSSGKYRDYDTHSLEERENVETGIYDKESLENIKNHLVNINPFRRSSLLVYVFNKIYKTEQLKNCQELIPEMISIGEDIALLFSYILKSKSISVTEKSYYHYCIRQDSITGKRDNNEEKRVRALFDFLNCEASKYSHEITNIYDQIDTLEVYMSLLRIPEKVIRYDNGVLHPYGHVSKSDRIVLYGAGRFGKQLRQYMLKHGFDVVLWVDKNSGGEISPLEKISEVTYDKVVVAVLMPDIVSSITTTLLSKGIPDEKMLFITPDSISGLTIKHDSVLKGE